MTVEARASRPLSFVLVAALCPVWTPACGGGGGGRPDVGGDGDATVEPDTAGDVEEDEGRGVEIAEDPGEDAVEAGRWLLSLGGAGWDVANSVASGGGTVVLAGPTNPIPAVRNGFWLVELDGAGGVVSQRIFDLAPWEEAHSVIRASDGSTVAVGFTNVLSGEDFDVWAVRMGPDGTVRWQRSMGGSTDVAVYTVAETGDGGFAMAGEIAPTGPDDVDLFVMKMDGDGAVLWQRMMSGAGRDSADAIVEVDDGSLVIVGDTSSTGAGENDMWVVKLDASGSMAWQKTLGGADMDFAYHVTATGDGGLVVAGKSMSFGAGGYDVWVVKLDTAGEIVWQKRVDGSVLDEAFSIVETHDGGLVVAGALVTDDGGLDMWLFELAGDGSSILWQRAIGGSEEERAHSVAEADGGDLLVAGFTETYGAGDFDAWVARLASDGTIPEGCPLIRDTAATLEETTVSSLDSTLPLTDTDLPVEDVSTAPGETEVEPSRQCPE